jgi:hypothetical protein
MTSTKPMTSTNRTFVATLAVSALFVVVLFVATFFATGEWAWANSTGIRIALVVLAITDIAAGVVFLKRSKG